MNINGDSSVPSLPSFGTYVSRYGGSFDGIITISGKFILDSASPTYVVIKDIDSGSQPPISVE